jgi:hypothetical protein
MDAHKNANTTAGLLHGGEPRLTPAIAREIEREQRLRHGPFLRQQRGLTRLLRRRGRAWLTGSGSAFPDGAPPVATWVFESGGKVWKVTLTESGGFHPETGKWHGLWPGKPAK